MTESKPAAKKTAAKKAPAKKAAAKKSSPRKEKVAEQETAGVQFNGSTAGIVDAEKATLPVERSGLSSITHDESNPAFALKTD